MEIAVQSKLVLLLWLTVRVIVCFLSIRIIGRAIAVPPCIGIGISVGVGVRKMLTFLCDGQGTVRQAILYSGQVFLYFI